MGNAGFFVFLGESGKPKAESLKPEEVT